MNYVIIGNSTAAVGCIEGIRTQDAQGEITVVSNEKYHTYGRPLISYLLSGKTALDKMKYRPDDFYDKNNCKIYFEKDAVKIDSADKTVILGGGEKIKYDKLLVATGSAPFVPDIKGLDGVKNKFTFMSLDDALALDASLNKDSEVLIIGAGLIGLKCAEGIYQKVKKITVVDLVGRILPSILDEEGSGIVMQHIQKAMGVDFVLSDSVAEFKVGKAVLKSGKQIKFDAAVIAVGVRPNTKLLEEAGGEVERGIVVDNTMQTTLKDIYAAGDCTLSHDITTGQNKILALLPNAYMQGFTAGVNMAGGTCAFDKAIPMNAIGFAGLHIITAGDYSGEAYVKKGENTYKKLVTKDNLLKGYILIGNVQRAGIYTSLIREQTPIDSIDFDLVKENPQLMAFDRGQRAKMLGGAK